MENIKLWFNVVLNYLTGKSLILDSLFPIICLMLAAEELLVDGDVLH